MALRRSMLRWCTVQKITCSLWGCSQHLPANACVPSVTNLTLGQSLCAFYVQEVRSKLSVVMSLALYVLSSSHQRLTAVLRQNNLVSVGKASMAPSGNCYECGRGYWCEGGAERVDCPEGSSTKSTISNSFEECRCDPGWQPIQSPSVEATRNGSHRCEMCPPGFYKINSGDDVCILPCTVNAWSELGAMSPDDCFCKNGTYKVEKTQTCDSCSGDAGIHCAGGFAYNSSGNRTQDAEVQSWLLFGWPCVV